MREVNCDYCNKPAVLVGGDVIYPHRSDLKNLKFWKCTPCGAYVGCHKFNVMRKEDGTKPLGRLADANLRKLKSEAHKVFDPYWKQDGYKRKECYESLAIKLGIKIKDCHIGEFSEEQCMKTIEFCHKGLM